MKLASEPGAIAKCQFIMIIIPEKTWSCMYCGDVVEEGKPSGGEHIVQESIGGGLTLNGVCDNRVCDTCNNKLSPIDQELCSKSHLSVLASQQLDANLWQAWDIDHESTNLIIESRPKWDDKGFVGRVRPQKGVSLAG